MTKRLFALISLSFLFAVLIAGCTKTSTGVAGCTYVNTDTVAPAAEITYIHNYLISKGLTATQHTSGLFYTINTAGTGTAAPVICSKLTVMYTGWLFSGFKFTEVTTPSPITLGSSILGWQKGLQLLTSGGTITLYVPPSLAYGVTGSGATIPPNSYLIFTIQLLAFQ